MPKRFGRTLISPHAARKFKFQQICNGSDHADLSGDCESPRMVAFTGLRDGELVRQQMLRDQTRWPLTDYAPGIGWIGDKPDRALEAYTTVQHVDVAVRCRRCPTCLKARAYHWQMRAEHEIHGANRTWFSTFTLAPEWHFRCLTEARHRLIGQGLDLDALGEDEIFLERCRPLKAEFQRYLKRIRRGCPGIRFSLVVEKHKSGLPHLHALVHEREGPIRHRVLTAQWKWGFSKHNLVAEGDEKRRARYVCKYLTKSCLNKIVASKYYGSNDDEKETITDPNTTTRSRKTSMF